MELHIHATLFRFVPITGHVREVHYGSLFVLIQHYNDPPSPWEQERALESAASLLRYRWERLSAHQRLHFLVAIKGGHRADDRNLRERDEEHRIGMAAHGMLHCNRHG